MNFLDNVELVCKKETKIKDGVIQINHETFSNFDEFKEEFSRILRLGFKYSLLVRTSYVKLSDGAYTQYKMLGEQIGFTYYSTLDFDNFISEYHDIIKVRLSDNMDNYDYKSYDIINLQFLIFVVGEDYVGPKLSISNVKPIGAQKDLVNMSKIQNNLKFVDMFGELDSGNFLRKKLENGIVKSVFLNDGKEVIIDETINKHNNNTVFSKETKFYTKVVEGNTYIFCILDIDKKRYISVYSLSGILVNKALFEYIGNDRYTRKMHNVKLHLDKTGVYRKDIEIKLGSVYPYKITGKVSKMIQPDWRFGTMDLETYRDGSISKVYSLGFYTKHDLNTYYIDKDYNSDDLIMKCLDDMLVEKYNGYVFYIHNLTNYDVYFLFRVIISRPDKYKCEPNFRDDDIIGIKITCLNKNKRFSIKIADSYNMLKSDLNKLCVTFDTPIKKSYFPYDFVNKNTLYYIGDKPEIKHYNKIDNNEYNNIKSSDWNIKEETLDYLKNDLVSLFSVMEQFINKIYINYHIHATKSMTISSLAMDIYLRKFYKNNIPLIKQKSIYNDIKCSYFGGITEVYKPYGKNLYYYDVNSLYPYAALNDMPGLNCVYSDNLNTSIQDFDGDFFGFYYCKIKAADKYIGLLPYRSESGLVMGIGSYEGWYFSEELKYASDNGYDISVIKGYSFDRNSGVFDTYIKHMYQIKSTTNDEVERQIVKSLLNNLLGRFGLDINKYITSLVEDKEFRDLIQTRKFRGIKFIEDKILLSYEKDVNINICDSHEINYKDLINSVKESNIEKLNEEGYHDVSVAISSAVTSYARIFMSKVKMDILNKGGSIYYTDTDSIVTDVKLEENMVGNNLGQFKLEHNIKEGYFISNKTYCFITDNNKIISKNKGVYSGSLNFDNFKSLYLGKEVKAIRYHTDKNYTLGSATLFNENKIIISPNSYTKRVKIYKDNLWVDTRPIQINKYHKFSNYKIKLKKNNLLKYIFLFIGVSLIIIFILLLPLVPYNIPDMSTYDFVNLSETNSLNYNENVNIKNEENNIFSRFLSLFNKNSVEVVYNKPYCSRLSECIVIDKKPLDINVLDKVKESHFNSIVTENVLLKEKISEFMIKDLRSNIDKIERIKLLNSIIEEIDNYSELYK